MSVALTKNTGSFERLPLVGTSRRDVPARETAGGTSHARRRNHSRRLRRYCAARTARRAVPTSSRNLSLPNNTNQWGPWAGKILTGDETQGILYTIDTNGTVAPYDLGIASENFDLIQTNQDLYLCDFNNKRIVKVSRAFLTGYAGDLLITQESPAELFIVNWNGTSFVTRAIGNYGSAIGAFEEAAFAPINLPSQPIQ